MEESNSDSDVESYLNSPLGKEVLQRLSQWLPDVFGYNALILGNRKKSEWLETSRIINQHSCSESISGEQTDLIAKYTDLPFQHDVLDLVLLPYILEGRSDLNSLINELNRIVIAEGHVVIVGFNPFSLWGLQRKCCGSKKFPWKNKFVSAYRIQRMLIKIGFSIERSACFYYRPPVKSKKWLKRLRFLEFIGAYGWPGCGAVYMIKARKRVSTLTPLKVYWWKRRRPIRNGYVVNYHEHK